MHALSVIMSIIVGSTFLDPSDIVMDEQIFSHSMCQRVYQYLRRHVGGFDLDSFSFINNVEGSKTDCLKIFLQYVTSLFMVYL